MKKTFKYMLAAFAVVTAASCAQELEDPNATPQKDVELVPMTIKVGTESKVTVVDDKTLVWCDDDKIAVWDGVQMREFTVLQADGKTATFQGEVAKGVTQFTAVYPFAAAVGCDSEGVITATVPSVQALDGGNVADNGIVAVCEFSKGEALDFKTANGYLRVDVSYDDVTEIIIDGASVAGTAQFNADGTVKSVGQATGSVSMTPSGEKFGVGSYYIALLPGTTPAGQFNITLVRANNNGAVMTATKEVVIPRNAGFFAEDTKLTESFVIRDAASLKTFLENAKNYTTGQLATIVNDIDLTGETITSAASFKGTLDGRGHSIKNWTSNATALFTTYSGTVKNLVLDSSCSLSFPSTGGKFGFIANEMQSNSILDNCVNNAQILLSTDKISGEVNNDRVIDEVAASVKALGTFVGISKGSIRNCINNGNITITVSGNTNPHLHLGGIAGYSDLTDQIAADGSKLAYDNCVNNGNITYTVSGKVSYAFVGGISGGTEVSSITSEYSGYRGTLNNCKNTGKISYTVMNGGTLNDNEGLSGNANYTKVGGVVGYWEGDIDRCTNGELNSTERGSLSFQVPTNDNTAALSSPSFGGVAGYVTYNVKKCVNYAPLYMKGTFAGGTQTNMGAGVNGSILAAGVVAQVGTLLNPANYLISDCHNFGDINFHLGMAHVNGTEANAAGVVGYANTKISNCSNNGKVTIEGKCHINRYAGVAGHLRLPGENLTNKGEVNIKTIRSVSGTPSNTQYRQCSNNTQQFAGVVAYTVEALSNITNTKPLNLTIESVDTNNGQIVVGGAVGRTTNAVTLSNNEGAMTIEHASSVKGAVVAGVLAWASKSAVTDVKNTGNITYKGNTQSNTTLYYGGVIAHTEASTFTGTNQGVLTANCSVQTLRFGGLVGNAPSATSISGTNGGSMACDVTSCSNAYVGGVVGHANSATSVTATNNGNLSCDIQGSNSYLGGIAGYITTGASITATNNGSITMNKVANSPRIAGIVGVVGKASTFEKCSNNKDINITSESEVSGQFYVSGICAFTETSSTFTQCSNAGSLKFSAPSCSTTSNSYIAGICQSSQTKQYYDTCSNTGDITLDCVTNAARIGGIAGYNANGGYFRNCTCDLDITISKKVNGTVNAGGIAGYCNPCEFTKCSYFGNISVKGKGNTAGILGAGNNSVLTMTGCSVNATIKGDGQDTFNKGLLVGYLASNTCTLGTADSPCKVVSGTKINGELITTNNLSTYLVGYKGSATINGTNTSLVTE